MISRRYEFCFGLANVFRRERVQRNTNLSTDQRSISTLQRSSPSQGNRCFRLACQRDASPR